VGERYCTPAVHFLANARHRKRRLQLYSHCLPPGARLAYHDCIMTKAKTPIPEGFHTLTPHLTVNAAVKYIDFLKRAFGAVEVSRSPGQAGKLMHAHVRIGDSDLMFNDSFPEHGSPLIAEGHWPFALHLYVADADAVFAQAVAAGCKVTMPLADQFWGDRYGHVKDPFGFTWAIATHIEDPTPAEIQEREKKLFGAGEASA
jgi:PhnB protein